MPDYITLELVSIPQFGESSGRHCSLLVISVELLENCADKTLPYFMTELEHFLHQGLRLYIASAGQMDSLLVSITDFPYACGQVAPRVSATTELAFPCLIPNLLLMCLIYSLSSQLFAPSVWTILLFQAKTHSHCALGLLLLVTSKFCNQTANIHDLSC